MSEQVQSNCVVCSGSLIRGEFSVWSEELQGDAHDTCVNVKRDESGRPWFPGEMRKRFATQEGYDTVTREEAFRVKP